MNDVNQPTAADARKPVSHRAVWVGLVALALVILAVFGGGYWLLVKYEPRAARHIPATALAAVRVDVEQVVLYEPLRRHLFPVLNGGEGGDRLKRFKALSSVNLGMDLREVVVSVLPEGQVAIAVGGLFPSVGLVGAMYEVSRGDAGAEKCSLEGAILRCGGALFRQADDGTLVIATSASVLDAAAVSSDWAKTNGLPAAPLAVVVKAPGRGALPAPGLFGQLGWMSAVERLTGWADLGDPLQVELAFEGLSVERAGDVRAAVVTVQALAALNPGSDVAGEREVLSKLKVDVAAGRPVVRSTWSRSDVDRGVRAVADLVAALMRPFQPS